MLPFMGAYHTDGKSFWPIATNIMDEKDFTADPLLSTREGNVSAVLQRTNDGNLVISLFYTEPDGTITEKSSIIMLPIMTSLRTE